LLEGHPSNCAVTRDSRLAFEVEHSWDPLTSGIGQPIVPDVKIEAIRANLDENHARTLAELREPPWPAEAFVLPLKTLAVAAISCLCACKQPLVVGEYRCPVSSLEGGSLPSKNDPVSVPWATGFENQLDCDYKEVAGYCYSYPPASYRVVTSPVHSGQFAAEFTVLTGTDAGAHPQGRCIREGVFPAEAYYGAWYYIPESATSTGLWNLFHFQSGNDSRGLWDVSLVNGPTGELNLRVFNFLSKGNMGDAPPVPIGSWVHIVFYWKRARDTTGEIALYQNEVRVVDFTNLVTDDNSLGRGQWFVGNLASALQPPESTVYVDDVTIRATP
jgi:hypothetical protein